VFRRSSAGATDGTAQGSRDAQGPGASANETAKTHPATTERPATKERGAAKEPGAPKEPGTSKASSAPKEPGDSKERTGAEAKKGRPTPKRSEAERNRYQPITGSKSGGSRAGTTGPRATEDRGDRARRMDAMKRGEEWALGPRDRGPARKLARDYVDAHRRPSEYYMYVLILLLVALLSRNKALNSAVSYLVIAMIAVILVDALLIRRALGKLIAERLPGVSTRGLTVYAVMRALQIRRWRMPAPRLKPGDKL
jgi:hypothetical protein